MKFDRKYKESLKKENLSDGFKNSLAEKMEHIYQGENIDIDSKVIHDSSKNFIRRFLCTAACAAAMLTVFFISPGKPDNSSEINREIQSSVTETRVVSSETTSFSAHEDTVQTEIKTITSVGTHISEMTVSDGISFPPVTSASKTQETAPSEIFSQTKETSEKDDELIINSPSNSGLIQLFVSDTSAHQGDTAYVDICVGSNTGFTGFMADIWFDENILEFTEASLNKKISEKKYSFNYSTENKKLIIMNKTGLDFIDLSDEELIRLTFKVKEDAKEGRYMIKLKPADAENLHPGSTNIINIKKDMSFSELNAEFKFGYIEIKNS